MRIPTEQRDEVWLFSWTGGAGESRGERERAKDGFEQPPVRPGFAVLGFFLVFSVQSSDLHQPLGCSDSRRTWASRAYRQ